MTLFLCPCVLCRPTEACDAGRSSLVILRCAAAAADTPSDSSSSSSSSSVVVQLSSRCAVGTCDGCNFVFMVQSPAACPVCTESDFHSYKTLCVDGRRQIITDMITYVSLCLSVFLSVCLGPL